MTLNELFNLGMKREIPELLDPKMGLLRINCGAGAQVIPGVIALDVNPVSPDAIVWDASARIPLENGSVEVIHAYHFLEHVANPLFVLREFARVLAVGGVANIVVPYYRSAMQAQDLTHRSAFTEDTWRVAFANPFYNAPGNRTPFVVGTNVIMGVVERNLALVTQLIRVE